MEPLLSAPSQDALPSTQSDSIPMTRNNSEPDSTSGNLQEDQPQRRQNEVMLPDLPPPPPDNWRFNMFLDDIAEEIGTDDLDKLKFYLGGHESGGIGKKELEKIKTPHQLFTILKSRGFLTRDNLIYLQKLLLQLKKKNLHKRAIQYANDVGNVIHFYQASEEPENGYKYIRVHVEGLNFRNCDRKYVQNLRNRVSAILFIPPEFVVIAGVEPSSSLLITFMIPEMYAELLVDILDEAEFQLDLQDLSIDIIEVQGKRYSLRGVPETHIVATDQQQRLETIYQQLERTHRQLEDSEIERLRLEEELKDAIAKLETERFEMKASMATLQKMFVSTRDGKVPASLASQTALLEFQKALRHPTIQTYEKHLLQAMLDTSTTLIVNRIREEQTIKWQQLQLMMAELKSQLQPLYFEIAKYQFFSGVDIEELDKKLLENFKKLYDMFQVKVEVQITEPFLQILKKITQKLNFREKDKLSKKYNWKPDEDLKQMMDKDGSFFLAAILYKEILQKRQKIDEVEFISQCLRDVRRPDLVETFKHLVSKTLNVQGHAPKKGNTKAVPKKTDEDMKEDTLLIRKMARQVEEIHDMLQDTSKAFSPASKILGHPPPYSQHDMPYSFKMYN